MARLAACATDGPAVVPPVRSTTAVTPATAAAPARPLANIRGPRRTAAERAVRSCAIRRCSDWGARSRSRAWRSISAAARSSMNARPNSSDASIWCSIRRRRSGGIEPSARAEMSALRRPERMGSREIIVIAGLWVRTPKPAGTFPAPRPAPPSKLTLDPEPPGGRRFRPSDPKSVSRSAGTQWAARVLRSSRSTPSGPHPFPSESKVRFPLLGTLPDGSPALVGRFVAETRPCG